MRVGVYVDGFNLYYGGRGIFGRGVPGWRWLDPRALSQALLATQSGWPGPFTTHVVLCTARITGSENAQGQRDQDAYLRALKRAGACDLIEFGRYVARCVTAPLAVAGRSGKPALTTSAWPVMICKRDGQSVPDALFMVSVARREEKGSDVNVAVHLLRDVLLERVDAAVVVSNDSDLKAAIEVARDRVPVGVVNPTKGYPAGALNGSPTAGAGGHWWYQLRAADFTAHQLPARIGNLTLPVGW